MSGRAAKIRARKWATRKLYGQNAVLIEGKRVELVNGRVPSALDPIESERQQEQNRQREDARQRMRAERVSRIFTQESPELTEVTEPCPDDVQGSVTVIRERIGEALTDAQIELQQSSGIFLTDSWLDKLRHLSRANLGRNWLSKDTWLASFDLLQQLGVLTTDSDYRVGEPTAPVTEQESRPMTAEEHDILLDKTLRESDLGSGDKAAEEKAKRAVVAAWADNALACEWYDSLRKNFNVSLSPELFDICWRYIQQMNLSPYSKATYDRLRIWLVASGRLPEHCLTVGEVLSQRFDNGTMTERDYLTECRRWKDYLHMPRKSIEI